MRIFIDFDGTITVRDVGDSIFERFLDPGLLARGWHREIIGEWKAGRISSGDCITRECENTLVTREELDTLLDSHSLTPGFGQMVEHCRERGIPMTILSDGFDYYIAYLLEKFGFGDIEHRANHLFFTEGLIGVDFPHMDNGCGRCGNCKRWHIETARRDGEKIVYIGDGYSDRYAVQSADIVFARRDLAEYCAENGIAYVPFENFYDVIHELENGNGSV